MILVEATTKKRLVQSHMKSLQPKGDLMQKATQLMPEKIAKILIRLTKIQPVKMQPVKKSKQTNPL